MPGNDITLRLVAKDLASGQISKAIGSIDKLAQRGGIAGSVMQGVGISFGMMLNPVALAARGMGVVTDTYNQAIAAGSDLVESQSKVDAVFTDNADTVHDWAEELDSAYGISKQGALEAAGTFGNFAQALGLTREDATDLSTTLVELAGDLGSFNNVARDEVLVALRSGLAGETEPMRRLGVDISAARINALALAEGITGVNGKLTEAQKVQLRYKAILDDTTTAQGDAIRTADTYAGKQRQLAAEGADAMAELGKAMQPVAETLAEITLAIVTLPDAIGDTLRELGREQAVVTTETEQVARAFGIEADALAEADARFREYEKATERARLTQLVLDNQIGQTDDDFSHLLATTDDWNELMEATGAEVEDTVEKVSRLEAIAEALVIQERNAAWVTATFGASMTEAAADVEVASDAVSDFRKNLDEYDDVRSVDKVTAAIKRTRQALERAIENEDWATVARRKSRLEQLRNERDVSQAAEDGAKAWAEAKDQEKKASDDMQRSVSSDVDQIVGDLDTLDNTTATPAVKLRDMATADIDALQRRLDAFRNSVTTVNVNAGITFDPVSGQVRSTTNRQHTGGTIGPGETAIVRQNEALVTPAAKTAVVPLDGPGSPSVSSRGGDVHLHMEGAYIIGSADKLADEIGPALSRWMRN